MNEARIIALQIVEQLIESHIESENLTGLLHPLVRDSEVVKHTRRELRSLQAELKRTRMEALK